MHPRGANLDLHWKAARIYVPEREAQIRQRVQGGAARASSFAIIVLQLRDG